MITLTQFENKYNGHYLDYDHAFGFQCVDVMRAYTKEVLGLEPYVAIPTRGNAKDIYNDFKTNQYFRKVTNLPSNAPKRGDIFFLGTYPFITGLAGHVGIVESANIMNLILFNQNYPTNNPCNYRKFSYRGALGWLTPLK